MSLSMSKNYLSLCNNIGNDKVKLQLVDYSIKQRHKLKIKPANIDGETGQALGEYNFFHDVYANSIEKYNEKTGFHFKMFYHKGRLNVTAEFSPSRMIAENNYKPASFEEMQVAFQRAENYLNDTGVETNLLTAKPSRVDWVRNIFTDEKPANYESVLDRLIMSRGQLVPYYGTKTWKNKQHQIQAYDKCDEMRTKHKIDVSGYPDTLRLEHRCMNPEKVRNHYGFHTAQELVSYDGFNHAIEKYLETLKKNIFRYDVSDIEQIGQTTMENSLRSFKNVYGKHYLSKYVQAYGISSILKICSFETFITAVCSVDEINEDSKERKYYRYKKKFEKIQFDMAMIETDLFSGKTNSELYIELKSKALAVA